MDQTQDTSAATPTTGAATTTPPVTATPAATTAGTPEHETLLQKIGDVAHKFIAWLGTETIDAAEDVAPLVYNVLNVLKNNFGIITAIDQYIPGLPASVATVINTQGPALLQKALAIVGGVETLSDPTPANIKAEALNILQTITGATPTQQQKFWTSFGTDLGMEIVQIVDQEEAGTLTWGAFAVDLETIYQQEQTDETASNS